MKIRHAALSYILFCVFSPLFIAVAAVVGIYRLCITAFLKRKYGKRFKGLISGSDVLFTVGGDVTKGVINAVLYVIMDKSSYDPVTTPQTILTNIRRKHGDNLFKRRFMAPRIFYTRNYSCGYSFWLDEDPGRIESYIRPLDFETDDDFVTPETVRKVFSKYCNMRLPEEHTRNWEFLVGNKAIVVGDKVRLPVLYRVSHVMGDGVTLMRLFIEVMTDDPKSHGGEWDFWKNEKSKITIFNEKFMKAVNGALLILLLPYYAFRDLLRRDDENILHPEELTGERILYWTHEVDAEFPLLETLKKIRRQYPGTRFNDVLLAMAAKGIAKVFSDKSHMVPRIEAVVTERLQREGKQLDLRNRLLLDYKPLPIEKIQRSISSDVAENFSHFLGKIKTQLSAHELLIRDLVFQGVPSYFPQPFVGWMLRDLKGTFAFSVLPALNTNLVYGGYELQHGTYFVPIVARLGITIAACTYGNKLNFGIQADTATKLTESDLKMILEEILDTMRSLKETSEQF